jgi:hypothetical protein
MSLLSHIMPQISKEKKAKVVDATCTAKQQFFWHLCYSTTIMHFTLFVFYFSCTEFTA